MCSLLPLDFVLFGESEMFWQGLEDPASSGSVGLRKRECSVRERQSVMTELQVMEMCCRLICSLWKN